MVKHYIMFLLKVCFAAILMLLMTNLVYAQSDDKLALLISSTDKQWGEYLRATLRYQGPKMLRDIDLKSWQKFVVVSFEDKYIDEDKNGKPVQVLQLRLHPRKTGAFSLPSLKLGTAHSQSIDINIARPIVKNAAIKLDWQISTLLPWQRQAVLIRVQLQTSDYAAHIKLDMPGGKQFLSRVLKTERHVLADGNYRFDAGWILYPMKSGLLELDLPPVRYQIAGSDRRQFYLPLQQLQVKALPNYLPPTLPVGKLIVHSIIIDDKQGYKQWRLNIKTEALIPYGVPGLDSQLARFSEKDIANVEIKHTQQSGYSEYGDRSTYLSPMPDWLMPFGKNLKITLRFFDAGSGRLSEVSHDLPRRWNMPAWAWWITVISGFVAAAFAFRYQQYRILTQINRLKLRHQLRHATSIKHMRRLILDCGQYATLAEWQKNSQARKHVIHSLNRYCFSASGMGDLRQDDFLQLKTDLLKLV